MGGNKFKLEFLGNPGDLDQGLGHAGIETYTDAPYAGTARECGQNSADAKTSSPVLMTFDSLEIDASDIGDMEMFRKTIDSCLQKSKKIKDEKGIDFFTRATEIVKAKKIKVFKIADFNTTGLVGPCESGSPFHALLKGSGVNNKQSEDSGGSFGIGKNAVYSISELRTVFYSTIYENKQTTKNESLLQGKSVLVSHKDGSGNPKMATGYWGDENISPVKDFKNIPHWLQRDKIGTSIYAIGFRDQADWQYRMAASLITNFFTAIHDGDFAFELNDRELKINKKTLKYMFNSPEIIKAAKDSNQQDHFEYAKCLYECQISNDAVEKTIEIQDLGDVSIRILSKDKFPKRIGIVRNGMLITDSLEKFGDKFARFSMCKDFVALIMPKSSKGSTLIKTLENPKHDGLSAERITDRKKRDIAQAAMAKLAREIRSAIKDVTQSAAGEVEQIDELAEFFADEGYESKLQDPFAGENPQKYKYSAVVESKPKKAKKNTRNKVEGDEGGTGGQREGSGTGGDGNGEGSGGGDGSRGTGRRAPAKEVTIDRLRSSIPNGQQDDQRQILFNSDAEGDITLDIHATGMEQPAMLKVVGSDKGKVIDGSLHITVKRNERTSLTVYFDSNYRGPIEMSGSTIQGGHQ